MRAEGGLWGTTCPGVGLGGARNTIAFFSSAVGSRRGREGPFFQPLSLFIWVSFCRAGKMAVEAIGDDDDLSHVYLPNFKQL